MIQIQKMMVGDWVMFTDPDEGIQKSCQIEDEDFGQGERYYSLFDPIPLTGDVMAKNFLENHHNINYNISWFYNKDGTFKVDFEDDLFFIQMERVKYVHEVQHMLNLIGFSGEIVI